MTILSCLPEQQRLSIRRHRAGEEGGPNPCYLSAGPYICFPIQHWATHAGRGCRRALYRSGHVHLRLTGWLKRTTWFLLPNRAYFVDQKGGSTVWDDTFATDQDAYAEFYRTPFGCGKTVAGDRWRLTSILENRGTIVRFTLFASSTTDRHPSVRARLQARPRGNRVEA